MDILTFFQYFLELDTSNAIKDANNLYNQLNLIDTLKKTTISNCRIYTLCRDTWAIQHNILYAGYKTGLKIIR